MFDFIILLFRLLLDRLQTNTTQPLEKISRTHKTFKPWTSKFLKHRTLELGKIQLVQRCARYGEPIDSSSQSWLKPKFSENYPENPKYLIIYGIISFFLPYLYSSENFACFIIASVLLDRNNNFKHYMKNMNFSNY